MLHEGGAADIRRFIDPQVVRELLSDLVLPAHVRTAWEDWAKALRPRNEAHPAPGGCS